MTLNTRSLEAQRSSSSRRDKVYKRLNYLDSPQAARVQMEGRGEVLILSSNNYLGLCDEPTVVEAGIDGLQTVRRRHGERALHLRHVHDPSRARGGARATSSAREASLSFVSAWNANEALTATIAEEGDFVVSDALNHASIIDSMRLAKAITKCTTGVYKHADMDDLRDEARRGEGREAAHHLDRRRLLDGRRDREAARHPADRARARRDRRRWTTRTRPACSGKTGRGTAEHFGVLGEVDVITSTLGKALGGAAGGFVAGPAALCDYLTQRSRPQLFSNALPPTVAASALAAVQLRRAASGARAEAARRTRTTSASRSPRRDSSRSPGETPIVPIIVGETAAAIQMSDMLLDEGVFVTGFGFPVVPQGQARVRCQISAAHTRDDLDQAIQAFKKVGMKLGIIR